MKSIQIELSEKLAQELDAMVREGWFRNEGEADRLALLDFVRPIASSCWSGSSVRILLGQSSRRGNRLRLENTMRVAKGDSK